MTIYTEDGRLCMDNNVTENAIRPFFIGGKNFLFYDSVAGVKSSAKPCNLIETAKANGIEPYAYFKIIFTKSPQANSHEKIAALLPVKYSNERMKFA